MDQGNKNDKAAILKNNFDPEINGIKCQKYGLLPFSQTPLIKRF